MQVGELWGRIITEMADMPEVIQEFVQMENMSCKQQGPALYSTGNHIQHLVTNQDEKEYEGEYEKEYVYIYIYTTESLCCIEEMNTTL